MALQPQSARSTPSSPRLYLITPRMDDPAALLGELVASARTRDSAAIAAVLVRQTDGDERTLIDRIKTLSSAVQDNGAALLVDGHADIVARADCDGVHVGGVDVLATTLARLKPDRIVGAGGLKTRHDAMLAAEAGVDYVMFGEPDAQGRRPSFEAIRERVAWWAELFVVPCVAYATDLAEVDALCSCGVDFIAVEHLVFSDPRGPGTAMDDLLRRFSVLETSE
jgi:thiamine-phosphate pyrophosphorylase